MAVGLRYGDPHGRVRGRLAENISAPFSTGWLVLGVGPVTVTVEGNFAGLVHIRVSNSPVEEIPTGALSLKPEIGAGLTAKGYVEAEGQFQWIAVEVETVTSGTIDQVNLLAGLPT